MRKSRFRKFFTKQMAGRLTVFLIVCTALSMAIDRLWGDEVSFVRSLLFSVAVLVMLAVLGLADRSGSDD